MPATTYWTNVFVNKIKKAMKVIIENIDPIKAHKATWVAMDFNKCLWETLHTCSGIYRATDLGLEPSVYRSDLNIAPENTRAYEAQKCHTILEYLFMNNENYYEQYRLDKEECKKLREAK